MHLDEIQSIFNRSWERSFGRSKWLLTFVTLTLCGLLVVFCRSLKEHAGSWLAMNLSFLPFFLCSGILLALGVVLIRGYHDEIKKKSANYMTIVARSWETMLGAAYFTVPFLLLYLMLWMLLGIFILLSQVPLIGGFFAVVLSFAPFLINLLTLLLVFFMVVLLFFVTPVIALKGLSKLLVAETLTHRMRGDLFFNCILFLIGIFPFLLAFGLLLSSAIMTGYICPVCNDVLHTTLQSLFIMIPFAAIMAPAVVFFFNFAAESHVLMRRAGNIQ